MVKNKAIKQLKRKKEIAGNFMSFFPAGMVLFVLIFNVYDHIPADYHIAAMIIFMVIMLLPIAFFLHYAKALNKAQEDTLKSVIDGIQSRQV